MVQWTCAKCRHCFQTGIVCMFIIIIIIIRPENGFQALPTLLSLLFLFLCLFLGLLLSDFKVLMLFHFTTDRY